MKNGTMNNKLWNRRTDVHSCHARNWFRRLLKAKIFKPSLAICMLTASNIDLFTNQRKKTGDSILYQRLLLNLQIVNNLCQGSLW